MDVAKPKKVLLLGSGGLKIGQAGEFDYSGSQAIKALKEEGIQVILINPNIATIQTDPGMADQIYLQPLNVPTVRSIIEKERPDAILLGFGGQTALNLGLKLEEEGILAEFNVRVLGSSVDTIRKAEDRELFKQECDSIGVQTAKSIAATTVEQALAAGEILGYPLMIRSGFSLGGLGSGIIQNAKELQTRAQAVLSGVPQILLEENLVGWSEFEYEIVRDQFGNALTICNMENFDPMGVHTGESIVVAPSQSLTNEEYHRLRSIAIKVAEHFQIIGECNIQYAFNLKTSDYRVIEINPRLSRSSALASKATGYPLAFVAAKLALGYALHELRNSITQKTCAFFEPALDYVVVKIPRWDKLKDHAIGTEMKSVGEVMAIGRSFTEALQKAVGMLNIGCLDLSSYTHPIKSIEDEIKHPTDRRLFAVYRALLAGTSIETLHAWSGIDLWFLEQMQQIAQMELRLQSDPLQPELLQQAKRLGFADASIARLTKQTEANVRALRLQHNIVPYVKQIDTLAGEFAAETNYLYMTYHGSAHDIEPSANPAVVILGSGPYSIGSSVEFDWCAVTASRTLRRLDQTSILINSNPETVSTDYDESNRLYFEQLSLERVRDILDFEQVRGVMVSVGGQIANNLVGPLAELNYPILGTPPASIMHAENRETFSSLLHDMEIDQPLWTAVTDLASAKQFAAQVGYPVLIRPSFVLSGAAMKVVHNAAELGYCLAEAARVSPDYPVVISDFIDEAKELDIDGVAKDGEVLIDVISEHIENAGVHSGDATVVLPPQRLYLETIRKAKKITRKIVKALNIHGPFNIQFLAKNNELKVIECNVRASRSFPFVSKVIQQNLIELAVRVMLNLPVERIAAPLELNYVAVKTPQFSYNRLKGSDPIAHVEMASTGEVACLGPDLYEAFLQSWLASDQKLTGTRILISVFSEKRPRLLSELKKLDELSWEFFATEGTQDFLAKNGIASHCVFKASEDLEPNIKTILSEKKVDLIINIASPNFSQTQISDGYQLRRLAIEYGIPLITNLQIAQLMLQCLARQERAKRVVQSWQEFVAT